MGMGNIFYKLPKLLEKSSFEIKLSSIVHRIPFITPPIVLMIDFERFIRRIDGDNVFVDCITLPFIELPLISETQSALLSAVGTESGGGDGVFLLAESWRNFLIELPIFVRNRKNYQTMATYLSFDKFFEGWDGVHGEGATK